MTDMNLLLRGSGHSFSRNSVKFASSAALLQRVVCLLLPVLHALLYRYTGSCQDFTVQLYYSTVHYSSESYMTHCTCILSDKDT